MSSLELSIEDKIKLCEEKVGMMCSLLRQFEAMDVISKRVWLGKYEEFRDLQVRITLVSIVLSVIRLLRRPLSLVL